MIRKVTAFLLTLSLLLSLLSFPAFAMEVEEVDLDITDLIEEVTEDTVRDKKDSDGAYLMTITCTGDFTIGGDNYHHKDIFSPELKKHGGDINFTMKGMRSIFQDDDLTLVNFEGTFTDTKFVPKNKQGNDFLFNISPSYVNVLTDNSIEAVSLENNHVMDHGEEGYEDTKETLRSAGVIYSNSEEIGVFEYKNMLQIAMLSYLCIDRYGKKTGEYDTFEEKVCADITAAKEIYPLVIVSFHWGREKDYSPTDNQIKLGRMAVDAGADLVIGHHSHRVQPIEFYNGKFICYSLGNFCFAGHSKPSDMSSIVFQIRYRVKEGNISYRDFRVIPIRISSTKERNDFIPTPFPDGYERDSVLMTLSSKDNIKNLPYAVTEFPLEWQ